MTRYALIAVASLFIVECNSSVPPGNATNTVGGADVVSSTQEPMATATTSFSLDWGKKAQAGQVAIADVLTYGGPKVTITAPDGWQKIRDDSTDTTRQSLYWHAIQANDSQHGDVDIQRAGRCASGRDGGARQCRDGIAGRYEQRQTGTGGTLHSDSVMTTADSGP